MVFKNIGLKTTNVFDPFPKASTSLTGTGHVDKKSSQLINFSNVDWRQHIHPSACFTLTNFWRIEIKFFRSEEDRQSQIKLFLSN